MSERNPNKLEENFHTLKQILTKVGMREIVKQNSQNSEFSKYRFFCSSSGFLTNFLKKTILAERNRNKFEENTATNFDKSVYEGVFFP